MACYLLTYCNASKPPVVVTNDYSAYITPAGTSISISTLGDNCLTVSVSYTCENQITIPSGAIVTQYVNCNNCYSALSGEHLSNGVNSFNSGNTPIIPTCYILTDCSTTNPQAPVIVTNDYSAFIGTIIRVSTIGDGSTCWQVAASSNCNSSIDVDSSAIITVYTTCLLCNPPIEPICYQLTDCSGVSSPIVVKTDLSALVGLTINNVQIIGLDINFSTCWSIATVGLCESGYVISYYNTKPFENCACCLPQPVPPPIVLPERVIPDPVVDYYRVTMSPCEVDANINFCQAYWNLTKKWRFGITTCEWNKHFRNLWVTKQLTDLHSTFNPLYCIEGDNNPPSFQQNSCTRCAPNPCSCTRNPQAPLGKCGCNTIFAGVPCREHEIPQTYILWSDLGVLLWS